MADHNITVTNAIQMLGVGESNKWGTMVWGTDLWGDSARLVTYTVKLLENSITPDGLTLTLTPAIVISNSITMEFAIQDTALMSGSWTYDDTRRSTYSTATAATTTYTAVSPVTTTWTDT